MIRTTYDKTVDALAITLRRGKSARTVRITDDIRIDFDASGKPTTLEVLNASGVFSTRELAAMGRRELSLKVAGARAGVSPTTLRVQIHNGRIKARKDGPDWVIDEDSLARYMASRAPAGRPAVAGPRRRALRRKVG